MDTPEDKESGPSDLSPREEAAKKTSRAVQACRDLMARNPRVREVGSTGDGFVIVGMKPPPPKTD